MAARDLIVLDLAEREGLDDEIEARVDKAWKALWPGLLRELLASRDAATRVQIGQEFAAAVVAQALPRKLLEAAASGASGRAAGIVAMGRRR